MGESMFGAWLEERQKKLKLSDTKLAAQIGVTAQAIQKWRTGQTIPRDPKHLDAIADALQSPREETYKMAGRWIPGLELAGLDPQFAEIAYALQTAHESLQSPIIKGWFFDLIKRKINEALGETESVIELHEALEKQGEK